MTGRVQPAQEAPLSSVPPPSLTARPAISCEVCVSLGAPNPQLGSSTCTHAEGSLSLGDTAAGTASVAQRGLLAASEQHRSAVGTPWVLASIRALLGSGAVIFSFVPKEEQQTHS